MNTYQITSDGLAIIITYPEGNKTLVNISDLENLKQGILNSKALANQKFDEQIAEFDRQIAFANDNTEDAVQIKLGENAKADDIVQVDPEDGKAYIVAEAPQEEAPENSEEQL